MPITINKESKSGSVIGVWHITEPLDYFVGNSNLTPDENEHYKRFIPELRKKHWLSYRLLINTLLGKKQEIIYDQNGKPSLKGSDSFISVSHSGEYCAVIINKSLPVGVDIEKITPRIEKVFDKFMNDNEIRGISIENRLEYMYIYWCSKEALYKMHGKGNLDFRSDMMIEPFSISKSGTLDSTLIVDKIPEKHNLFYEQISDYMLVYTPI